MIADYLEEEIEEASKEVEEPTFVFPCTFPLDFQYNSQIPSVGTGTKV